MNVKKARERDELHDVPFPPQGFNPCGEQPLHSREVCCLGEIILPKIKTEVEAKAALTMTYLFCKLAYTLGAPTEKRTEEISHANQRIGISLSGIGMDECVFSLPDFCEIAKPYLEFLDDHVSRMLGVNKCVALTTIKPGGTLSKLAGCPAPGIHRPISRYQIRRVRFSRRCSLVNWFPKVGIYTEPDVTDPDGTVVAVSTSTTGRQTTEPTPAARPRNGGSSTCSLAFVRRNSSGQTTRSASQCSTTPSGRLNESPPWSSLSPTI